MQVRLASLWVAAGHIPQASGSAPPHRCRRERARDGRRKVRALIPSQEAYEILGPPAVCTMLLDLREGEGRHNGEDRRAWTHVVGSTDTAVKRVRAVPANMEP